MKRLKCKYACVRVSVIKTTTLICCLFERTSQRSSTNYPRTFWDKARVFVIISQSTIIGVCHNKCVWSNALHSRLQMVCPENYNLSYSRHGTQRQSRESLKSSNWSTVRCPDFKRDLISRRCPNWRQQRDVIVGRVWFGFGHHPQLPSDKVSTRSNWRHQCYINEHFGVSRKQFHRLEPVCYRYQTQWLSSVKKCWQSVNHDHPSKQKRRANAIIAINQSLQSFSSVLRPEV